MAKASRKRSRLRALNPQQFDQVFFFAASDEIRKAAQQLDQRLTHCRVKKISDPSRLCIQLHEKAFVLFVDEGAIPFFDRPGFKASNPYGAVVLLSTDLRVGSAPTQEEVERICPSVSKADITFYIDGEGCRPELVMPSIVRYVEDKHNIEHHKRAKRFIFLVVDDELRWFSQFLPVLYRIIGRRAKIMLARTYEEATAVVDEHGSDIVCLITDMHFPRGGVVSADAGRELVLSTKRSRPRIPIIIASKEDAGLELRDVALIFPKGDVGSIQTLDQYVHDFTGLGDFLFYRGKELWRRVSTLAELRDAVADAPLEMLEEYAAKDFFSTWLYMHGFRRLGDLLRDRRDHGPELRKWLLAFLDNELAAVEDQELVLTNSRRQTVGRAKNVSDLVRVIESVDAKTLEKCTAYDLLSMWLLKKGYADLADRLRPIQGEGEALRRRLLKVLRQWLGRGQSSGKFGPVGPDSPTG